MSITDELREYVQSWRETPNLMDDLDAGDIDGLLGDFEHIADRIDAEHERQMAERRRSCVFYDAERNYCKVHDEGDMAELGYVRLPVDTDGVPIRIGDVMDSRVDYLFDGKPFTVRALVLCEDGWGVADGRFGNRYEPDLLRHYHAPTVEDVLREFADEVYADADNEIRDRDFLCAKYAKRLVLADGKDA